MSNNVQLRANLRRARLYVVIDGRRSADDMAALAEQLLAAGADLLQLRDKGLNDRQLLERARRLRPWPTRLRHERTTVPLKFERSIATASTVSVLSASIRLRKSAIVTGIDSRCR